MPGLLWGLNKKNKKVGIFRLFLSLDIGGRDACLQLESCIPWHKAQYIVLFVEFSLDIDFCFVK